MKLARTEAVVREFERKDLTCPQFENGNLVAREAVGRLAICGETKRIIHGNLVALWVVRRLWISGEINKVIHSNMVAMTTATWSQP